MATVGLSFSPLDQSGSPGPDPGGTGSLTPVQDAIRLLSFKLPRVVGASAIAPGPLLQGGPTALGSHLGNSIAETWLKALFSGQPLPDLSTPSVTPGYGYPSSVVETPAAFGTASPRPTRAPVSISAIQASAPVETPPPVTAPPSWSAPAGTWRDWLTSPDMRQP